jgi:glycosyltransferase involved in cell wall biosynthesis
LGSSHLSEKLEENGIYTRGLNRSSYSSWKIARHLREMADYYQVDLLHCHDRIAANLSLYAARRLNIPFIYNVHCWSFSKPRTRPAQYLTKVNERFLTHQASVNVLASNSIHQEGNGHFKLPKAVVIPHGVDARELNPERPSLLSKRVYGIPEHYTVVGFLARLCRQKDPLTLLRAAALALKEERKLHFLIVGDGELKDCCLRETRKLGIENHVSFQDIKADIPFILNLFDVYCLPSRWEGLSVGLLEAMAMRKAIITSPVQGNLEVIANRTNGLLVAAGKTEAGKDAILELHRDERLRADIGRQARLLVERYYDIGQTVATYSGLYRKLVPEAEDDSGINPSKEMLYSIQ